MPVPHLVDPWLRAASPLVAAAVLLAGPAAAAEPLRRFDIPAKPLGSALLDFAVQAEVSMATGAAAACGPSSNPVVGRYGAREALRLLLAGTGCGFQAIDADAIRIIAEPRPRPAQAVGAERPTAPPPPPPPSPVDEVVVTAGRRAALLDRAPYSISSVGADVLLDSRAEGLSDLAGQIAGVSLTNLGPGRNKIFIRGLSDGVLTGKTQSTVGIYLDNVRITYNAPDPDLRLADVEKVEVLRGPQGALYGAGSIGGIVHVVTRQPRLDAFAATVTAGASGAAHGAPSDSVEAMVNIPLIQDRLALRLVGYDETMGGYIDDVGLGLNNVNRTTRRGGRASLKFQASPGWSVTAALTDQSIASADSQYAEPSVGERKRSSLVRQPHDNDFLQGSLTIDGDMSWAQLTATTSALHHNFDSRYDASTALPLFLPGAAVAPSPFDDRNTADLLVNEITLVSRGTRRLQWLAGAFYGVGENDEDSALTTPAGAAVPSTVYSEDRRDLVREAALYGELSYRAAPSLVVSTGGRLFSSRVHTTSTIVQTAATGPADFSGRSVNTGFAPQVVVRFEPDPRTVVYVQAAEGYRAGGFNTASTFDQGFSGPGLPPRRFNADELWSYEAGAKTALLDGALHLRAALYRMVWTDIQSDQLQPDGLPFTANIGDGRDTGAELESSYQPNDRWLFSLAVALAHPQLVRPNPQLTFDAHGLPGAPKLTVAGALAYNRPIGAGLSLRLRADLAYIGASRLAFDASSVRRMGDYGVGDLSASLVSRRWRLTAFFDRTVGEEPDTFAYGNPFTVRAIPQGTPARPATVGLQFSESFGALAGF